MNFLKNGRNKALVDRAPPRAEAPVGDPALRMRPAHDPAVGATAVQAMVETFGSRVTRNERGRPAGIRNAFDNSDPRPTARSWSALRAIFGT